MVWKCDTTGCGATDQTDTTAMNLAAKGWQNAEGYAHGRPFKVTRCRIHSSHGAFEIEVLRAMLAARDAESDQKD